jgi:hypothetical protein
MLLEKSNHSALDCKKNPDFLLIFFYPIKPHKTGQKAHTARYLSVPGWHF